VGRQTPKSGLNSDSGNSKPQLEVFRPDVKAEIMNPSYLWIPLDSTTALGLLVLVQCQALVRTVRDLPLQLPSRNKKASWV
jgi:hypothetical protein